VAVLTPQRQRLLPDTPSTTESKALKNFHRRDRHRLLRQARHAGTR
jgi:hypothetical protein